MSALGPLWTIVARGTSRLPNGTTLTNGTDYAVNVMWWTDGAVAPEDESLTIVDGVIVASAVTP